MSGAVLRWTFSVPEDGHVCYDSGHGHVAWDGWMSWLLIRCTFSVRENGTMCNDSGRGPMSGRSNHRSPQTTVDTAVKVAAMTSGMFHGQFGGTGVIARNISRAVTRKPMMAPGCANRYPPTFLVSQSSISFCRRAISDKVG